MQNLVEHHLKQVIIDLQNLVAVATPDDLAEVPPLLDKITQRGFAEGKDLHAVFRSFVDQMRQG